MQNSLRVIDGGQAERPDRGLLFDAKCEDAVIANILFDSRLLDEVRPFLKAEHFFSEARRRMYEAACDLRDAGQATDIVSVGTRLKDLGRYAQVGGASGLTELVDASPAMGQTQIVTYAKNIRDRWARRTALEQARALAARCENDGAGIEVIVAESRSGIDAVAQVLGDSERSTQVKPVLRRTVERLEAARATDGYGARPTGFNRLDSITAGLHEELMLIGARPGMGKTSLATSIAINRAKAGEGAYIASLETNDAELMTRMVCAEGRVALHRCRSGMMTPSDWSKVTDVATRFATLPIWVDDQSSTTATELWAKCRRADLQLSRTGGKLGLVVVDYIQLLRAPRANMKREETIAENARTLKAMAQDLSVTVLALAQLNRDCEKRPDKRPQLSDLRESGELEQCARTVLMLYRDDYYHRADQAREPDGVAEVHVAKQNNGPSGIVKLMFEEEFVRFDNQPDGWPR